MKKTLMVAAIVVGVAVFTAQLLPVDRRNPPVVADLGAPEPVAATLRASCYDCHSNETRWPWYSGVAPISWLVAHDVSEGREHLNFSAWGSYAPKKQEKLLREMHEEISDGAMPMSAYVMLHSDAKLSDAKKKAVLDWITSVSPGAVAPEVEEEERAEHGH